MRYEPGNVIALDDGKEYIIVYKINVANNLYGLLMSKDESSNIKIGTFKEENGETVFETTFNEEQAMYILESIIYQAH